MTLLLMLALAPPLYLIYKVYQMDRIEKEPAGLLVKLFFFGVLATIPAAIIEAFGERLVTGLFGGTGGLIGGLVEYFIVVALTEEGCKYFFLKRGSWNDPAFDYCFDAIVYSVAVSLGFAAFENVQYVFSYGLVTALVRAVTAIPGHAIFGIFMGHYYGIAKIAEFQGNQAASKKMLRKALWVPVLLHGFYDFAASSSNGFWTLLFIIYVIVLEVIAVKRIRRYSADDSGINWY